MARQVWVKEKRILVFEILAKMTKPSPNKLTSMTAVLFNIETQSRTYATVLSGRGVL